MQIWPGIGYVMKWRHSIQGTEFWLISPGSSGRIWFDNVHCTGKESTLAQCESNGIGVSDCKHSEDVGVVCSDKRIPGFRFLNPITNNIDVSTLFFYLFESLFCSAWWGNVVLRRQLLRLSISRSLGDWIKPITVRSQPSSLTTGSPPWDHDKAIRTTFLQVGLCKLTLFVDQKAWFSTTPWKKKGWTL